MNSIFHYLLNSLFPRYCLLCQELQLNNALLCKACVQDLPFHSKHQCQICASLLIHSDAHRCGNCLANKPYYDHTIALFDYQGPIPYLITRLKFSEELSCATLFGELLTKRIQNDATIKLPECLVAIPLHSKRLAKRGYNQAFSIAKNIAQQLDIPLENGLVNRIKATQAQAKLRLKQRSDNLKNAFALNRITEFKHVAIVDDVMTTGHTVNEFAKCLKKGGVKRVDVWCVARA